MHVRVGEYLPIHLSKSLVFLNNSLYWEATCRWPLDRGSHRQVMRGTILSFHLLPVCCSFELALPTRPSAWRLASDILSPPSLVLAAIRHKISGHELKLQIQSFFMGAQSSGKKQYKLLDLTWPPPYHAVRESIYMPPMGVPLQTWGCLQPGRKATTYLQEPPSSAI